jgi:hypothetical protein
MLVLHDLKKLVSIFMKPIEHQLIIHPEVNQQDAGYPSGQTDQVGDERIFKS